MRKLYISLAAFAALLFSQIGHAIPTIAGATDLASNDGTTYYALSARADGWYIDAYDEIGIAKSFSVKLTPDSSVNPSQQTYVGLAFDGSTFHVLRDDSQSRSQGYADSWTVASFNLDGSWNGNAFQLSPSASLAPSRQTYVGFDIADDGFFALRDDSKSASQGYADSWTVVGFDSAGAWTGHAETLDESPSSANYYVIAAYNNSPLTLEPSANNGVNPVPEPGTGLLLGSLLALGLVRRKLAAA